MPGAKVKSKDPLQQTLRDHKQRWNSEYRNFSQRLKALKDGFNGRGNGKAGIPPSNIKDPMPNEIGSILNELAGEFQKMVGDGERIISEQNNYSQKRRKKAPKPMNVPTSPQQQQQANPSQQEQPAAAPDQVVDALSRIGNSHPELISEASKFSRIWQYFTSILSSKDYNKERVNLLSQSADLYYGLLDLENSVLTLSPKASKTTIVGYKKLKDTFITFSNNFDSIVAQMAKDSGTENPIESEQKTNVPENVPSPQIEKPVSKKNEPVGPVPLSAPLKGQGKQEIDQIRENIHLLYSARLIPQNDGIELSHLFDEYEKEEDEHVKSMWLDQFFKAYENIFDSIKNEVQKRFGPHPLNNVQDIVNYVQLNMAKEKSQPAVEENDTITTANLNVNDYLTKISHNSVSRFLRRKLVQAIPFNRSATIRLQIIDTLDEMKTTIEEVMDNLEEDLSTETLDEQIKKMAKNFNELKQHFHILNSFFMREFMAKKEKQKHKNNKGFMESDEDSLFDEVLRRKLKRELAKDAL